MSPPLIFAGIFLPLFALTAWLQKRLRNAMAERHPAALHVIDRLARSAPRSRRALDRVTRYKMLQDPEIDRHIRNLSRVETLLSYAVLAFFAFVLLLAAVSAANR